MQLDPQKVGSHAIGGWGHFASKYASYVHLGLQPQLCPKTLVKIILLFILKNLEFIYLNRIWDYPILK